MGENGRRRLSEREGEIDKTLKDEERCSGREGKGLSGLEDWRTGERQ